MSISKTICTLTVALLAGCGPTIIDWGDDFTPLTAIDTATGEPDDTSPPPDIPDDCTPGTEACPCDYGDTCDDGLECNAVGECEPLECAALGCACVVGEDECAVGLSCIDGHCNSCPDGQLNCACDAVKSCGADLVCVGSSDGSSDICAPPGFGVGCDHLTGLDLPGRVVGTGCVADCTQGDSCGWLECVPIDAFADGFCAWPA